MSQENVETLLYEAWNREDFDGLLRYMDPEVETHPGLLPPGEETRFLGHGGVREWIRNVTDAWVSVRVEAQERIEIGSDRILATDRWFFRGREASRSRNSFRPPSPFGMAS